MAFDDRFRLCSHTVITNDSGQVLPLKAGYDSLSGTGSSWGLPGGALEPGETIHQALVRECREELGLDIAVKYLSGVSSLGEKARRLSVPGLHLSLRVVAGGTDTSERGAQRL
jgi:8-oxo-dGTP diphosphatase